MRWKVEVVEAASTLPMRMLTGTGYAAASEEEGMGLAQQHVWCHCQRTEVRVAHVAASAVGGILPAAGGIPFQKQYLLYQGTTAAYGGSHVGGTGEALVPVLLVLLRMLFYCS